MSFPPWPKGQGVHKMESFTQRFNALEMKQSIFKQMFLLMEKVTGEDAVVPNIERHR